MAGYRDAAIDVLSEAGKPLHSDEITRRAIDGGHIKSKGRTPGATMSAAIYMDIKKFGENSRFEQTGTSTFKLRGAPPAPPDQGDRPPDHGQAGPEDGGPPSAENDTMRAQRIGAAGEHRVMSELLFRGYGAERVTIDDGVDIWAEKDGCQFYVQVKTVTGKNGRYITTIGKKPFAKKRNLHMYYAFVLRDVDNRLDFVILSSKDVRKRISNGDMTDNKAGYQASFSKKGDKVFLGAHDATQYKNDWDL